MAADDPARPRDWDSEAIRAAGGSSVTTIARCTPQGVWYRRMFFDSPDVRLCSDWTLEELKSLAENLYMAATGQTIQDAADLAKLGQSPPQGS